MPNGERVGVFDRTDFFHGNGLQRLGQNQNRSLGDLRQSVVPFPERVVSTAEGGCPSQPGLLLVRSSGSPLVAVYMDSPRSLAKKTLLWHGCLRWNKLSTGLMYASQLPSARS